MKKVFFCYLDVLGFKNALKDKSDTDQVRIINSLFGYTVYSVPNFIEQPDTTKSIIDLESSNINSILISDSILLWTNDCDYDSLLQFIYKVQGLIQAAFMGGFPLRGTIEYGGIYHQEKLIPTKHSYNHFDLIGGSALINAYQQEQNFEWMGCVISSNCMDKIRQLIIEHEGISDFKIANIFKKNTLIEYEAPKKSGKLESYFTINWVNLIVRGIYLKSGILDIFIMHNKTQGIPWEVKRKIDNTTHYVKYIVDNKLIVS